MRTERDKMLAGEPYFGNDPELLALRERARGLCQRMQQLPLGDPARADVVDELIGAGGRGATITAPFFCDYGSQIELGEGAYFNFNCVVLDVCRVRIGARTLIGPAVQIYTAVHPMGFEARRRLESGRPVDIGEDVWIGGGAMVLPGVRIGDRTVVGAGSVVTRDLPSDVFAAGNPCRVIRRLD